MFKFLKRKLKGVLGKVADDVEKTAEEDNEDIVKPTDSKSVELFEKPADVMIDGVTKEEIKEEIRAEKVEAETKEKVEVKKEALKKKGIFKKITEKIITKKISAEKFDKLFFELEVVLLENNVAVEVIEKIKKDLKSKIVDNPVKRGNVLNVIKESLKNSVEELFVDADFDFISKVKTKKPFIICFVGINGSGKTTTIAKVVNLLQKRGLTCVLGAADTFRAASIEQIKEWGNKLKVRVIAHNYGSDPAAVAYDGLKHCESKGIDILLIDTAGRLHSDKNLMGELKKIDRVVKPDMKIFVGESITGNDIVFQVEKFNEFIGIDAIILTKSDVDEKGGAIISVGYVTKKPIIYLGTGQRLEDLKPFDKDEVIKNLGL